MDMDNSIEKTLSELQKVMNTNSIVGTPRKSGNKTIIPISKTALSFGLGMGNNSGKSVTEIGGVAGGGSIDPVAFVIISDDVPGTDGVKIIPIDSSFTSIESVLSSIGNVIFDFLGNSNVVPAGETPKEDSSAGNIEKIKTKIKPKSDEKK